MLRVHTSQRTEVLLDALARSLAGERERGSPFAPAHIVVPDRNVETYLRLGLAERLGIAANLETAYLRKLLAQVAERAVPDARVAGAAVVEGHLLALLHDERLLDGGELARVRGYLLAAGPEPDAVDRRRAQLAAQLAPLFDEYAGSRAEMLARWRDGGGRTMSEMEAWQRALWLALFAPGGRLERQAEQDGVRWLALEALWDEAMRASPPPFARETLHVFGLSYIARGYHRMLAALARVADVHVYTLNPCREALAEPLEAATHLALNLWGRPGRENLRLLAGIEGAALEQDFPDEARATTLLVRLQAGIVSGRAPTATSPREPDGSLRVLPCPSLRRELEVVAAEIWALLRGDPTLRACDVAVIVPEKSRQKYLAQLPAVFAESCGLPHNLADVPVQGSHPVAQAIASLIELPFSALSRKELLPLLTHPCVLARFPSAAAADWRALADALGIVRGADRGDFDPAYLRRDLYSWDQGLGRLALGAVADQGQPEADPTFLFGGEPYLPGPAIESDDDGALGFGLLARSLVADARFARQSGPRPIGQWLEFLRRMVTSYLVLDEEDSAGQALVGAFLASIDQLAEHGLGELPVSYRIAAELAKRALGELPWSRGRYLASGVTVASFVPMRAIPFRAVFVLGLGQDAFPRPHGRHELDLRESSRLPGDVDRREQDLYMFLETLLQARARITFSYVSRDELTGDELPASPALLELRAVLAQGYLDAGGLAQVFGDRPADRPPLRRYDDLEEQRQVLPAAEAEHRAKRLGQALGGTGDAASVARRVATLPPGLRAPLAAVLGLPSPTDGGAPAWPGAIKIPLGRLRRFLEDPLQASARFGLGMADEEDDDSASVEDEPFDVDRLLWSSILRQTMAAAIVDAQGAPPWEVVAAAHARSTLDAELAGRAPSGMFRATAAARQEEVLRGWQQGLREILGQGKVACRRFRFVPNLDDAGAVWKPPLHGRSYCRAPVFEVALGGATIAVTLVGETGLWAGGARDTALAFTTRQSIQPDELGREDLAAFLDHAALTAAGVATGPGFGSAVFHALKGAPGQRVRRFGRLTAPAARDYLARLCTALLRGVGDGAPACVHPYLLPHEAVLGSHQRGTPLAEEVRDLCAKDEGGTGFSSTWGPVPRAPERFAPPLEALARAMVAERFGLFFDLAREDGA